MILFDVEDEEVARALRRVLDTMEEPKEAFDEIGRMWRDSVGRNFREGGRPSRWEPTADGRRSTLTRTGRLQRSVRERTLKDGVQVGTRSRHARIHQEGGVVRPRRRRYLAIPLPGIPKSMAAAGAGALFRRFPGQSFTVWNSKGGTVMLDRRDDGNAEPVFVLRRKVRIKPRPFLVLQDRDVDETLRILQDAASGAFQ